MAEAPNERDHSWSLRDWTNQYVMALGYAMRGKRRAGIPGVLRTMAAHYLMPGEMRRAVPDPRRTLNSLDGFAGICPDLSPETVIAGYRAGLFQASHAGPLKWWSPEQRMVLFLDELHLEKNLKRKLRQGRFSVTFDRAFGEVVRHCAGPRKQRRIQLTWLTPRVIEAYERLNEAGFAHSVEIWDETGMLCGGLFGTGFGRVFATESQFAVDRDASKIAFAVLNRHLQAWGYALNDVRNWSAHLERLGCALVPREDYLDIVECFGADLDWQQDWRPEPELSTGDWDPAAATGWKRAKVLEAIGRAPREETSERTLQDFIADAEAGPTLPSAAA